MATRSQRILPVSRLTMLAAGVGVSLTFAQLASADDLPKQGNFAVTYTAAGTFTHTLDLGDGTKLVANDARLLATNDAGQGMFHNATAECIGVRGGETRNGYCVFTDKDGDKFVEPWSLVPGAKKMFAHELRFEIAATGEGSTLRLVDEADLPMMMQMMGAEKLLQGQLDTALARIQELAGEGKLA